MKGLTPAELAVMAAVDRDRIGADLAAIVQIPSLTGNETDVQTEVALRMTTAGLDVTRLDIDPATITADPDYPGMEAARTVLPVVAGRLAGGKPGPRRLVAGHIDVVSAGDELQWTVPPFSGRITDGELWGRGSVDMKGGVVAGLAALRAVAKAGVEFAGEVTLLTVPAEEDGGAGALAAIRAGYTGDAAVITEPTNLRIVTAQAGAITFTLTVTGRSAHAAFRRSGVSAFEKLALLAEALRANETARNEREKHRAMRALELPYPTVIGRVRAGDWSSSVPDRAVAEGRFGVRLGQTVEEAEAELREVIATACSTDPWLAEHPAQIELSGGRFASCAVASDHPLPWSLGEAARDVGGRLPPFVAMPYGSDARLFVNQGSTPTVLFGPGDPHLAHAPDERIALEQIALCARILALWITRAT